MSQSDARLRALESLLRPLDDGRLELVVTYRRFEDYDSYERLIEELQDQVKRLQQDLYSWTVMGNKYLQTLDELHRLEKILRKHNISY